MSNLSSLLEGNMKFKPEDYESRVNLGFTELMIPEQGVAFQSKK